MTDMIASPSLDDRLHKSFGFFDADGSGYVDYDDTVAMAARVTSAFDVAPDSAKGRALASGFEVFWHSLLTGLDLDGDRRISPDEYRAGMMSAFGAAEGDFERGLRPVVVAIIDVADTDDSGVLERAEFQRLQQAIGNPQAHAAEAFTKLDRDGSGTLSRDELVQAARDFHTGTDPDAAGNWLFGPA
ncbi:EF-hand domain-containing protein [Actinokineospora sp. 24-640]